MTTDPTPTRLFPCEYCTEGHTGDAGGSYDRSACKVRGLQQKIDDLKAEMAKERREEWRREKDEKHLRQLLREQDQARYVGD